MILFFGINNKCEKLNFDEKLKVHSCGKFGRGTFFVEYLVFSIFFIPIIKWNKKYFVEYNCCGSIYRINSEIGKKIERGENINLSDDDLHLITTHEICENCGSKLDRNYDFCPYCGHKRRVEM